MKWLKYHSHFGTVGLSPLWFALASIRAQN